MSIPSANPIRFLHVHHSRIWWLLGKQDKILGTKIKNLAYAKQIKYRWLGKPYTQKGHTYDF